MKLEIGTLEHAFRNEMSQVIHWSLILATALVVGLEITNVENSYLTRFFY